MNTEDQFEQRLRRQPVKSIPSAWREEILSTARAASPRLSTLDPRPGVLSIIRHQLSTLLWPHPKAWAGLAAVFRYHFLSLGRVVPYVELGGGPGGTDLKVREIDSTFSFLAWAGLGVSMFVSDSAAVYAGYRYEHNSNGNTDKPNRGWESNVAVLGVSYYFR